MKHLILGVVTTLILTGVSAQAGGEVTRKLEIKNSSNQSMDRMPLFIPVDKLGLSPDVRVSDARLLSAEETNYPCQIDDLNRNGVADSGDEVSMIVDIRPGSNRYELALSGEQYPQSGQNSLAGESSERYTSVQNSLVKVRFHTSKHYSNELFYKDADGWVPLASNFNYSPKLDQQWKEWAWDGIETSVASKGPARIILRKVMHRKNTENQKHVQVIHNWSVFTGRPELFCSVSLLNASKEQLVEISGVVSGFYDVTPGGSFNLNTQSFAGIAKDGTIVTGALKAGNYAVKKPNFTKAVWYDAAGSGSAGKTQGLGCVVCIPPRPFAVCLSLSRKKLRMTESYYPKGVTLWPGKHTSFNKWYVAHGGGYTAVKDFCALLNNLEISVGK